MLYYTDAARMSAIAAIRDCMEKIESVSGSELSYVDASRTNRFLSMLIDEIIAESRREAKAKIRPVMIRAEINPDQLFQNAVQEIRGKQKEV